MYTRNEPAKNYRVIIIGPGAIGGAIGGHLALSGTEVVLVGRPGHIGKIAKDGLRLVTPTGTHSPKLTAVTSPGQVKYGPDDVVFLCVKSQDTAGALQELKSSVTDIPLFCFQNGVRNEEVATGFFPRVYGVMVRIGGEYVTDGEITVRRDPPGWVIIGKYPRGTDSLAGSIAIHMRKGGFHALVTPEVMPYKWGKLMSNLANAIGAITNAKWEETRPIVQAVQEEARNILALAKIDWISQEELDRQWSEMTEKPRKVITTESQSSTWQSLARRQGSVETEFLNGEIVRLAERLGKKAPVNAGLIRISSEMAANREVPGKYSASELIQLLGINPKGKSGG